MVKTENQDIDFVEKRISGGHVDWGGALILDITSDPYSSPGALQPNPEMFPISNTPGKDLISSGHTEPMVTRKRRAPRSMTPGELYHDSIRLGTVLRDSVNIKDLVVSALEPTKNTFGED